MGKCPSKLDDMEIYPIIKLLNNFEYIQTYFCCSGHELWEKRDNHNLPYVAFDYKNKQAVKLARYIKLVLDAEYKSKRKCPGRIKPYLEIYDNSSLKIKGKYIGDFSIDESLIREIVMDFWTAMRNAIVGFIARI